MINQLSDTILACSYCFIWDACGHVHFIWGKAGIIYFQKKDGGIPRMGRSLVEGIGYGNVSLAWGSVSGISDQILIGKKKVELAVLTKAT